jgi:hypothetical protein
MRFRRSHDVNRMVGLDDFLASWENPEHPQNNAPVALHTTEYGNINASGEPGDYRGYTLSKWHARFSDSMEHGIRELVLLLVMGRQWITYSSCEGHYYRRRGLASVERRVGLFPRSDAEQRAIVDFLAAIATQVNRRLWLSPVRVNVRVRELQGDQASHSVVDLIFQRSWWATWERYYSRLGSVYNSVVLFVASRP